MSVARAVIEGAYPEPKRIFQAESDLDYLVDPGFWYFKENIFPYLFEPFAFEVTEAVIKENGALPEVDATRFQNEILEARQKYGIGVEAN